MIFSYDKLAPYYDKLLSIVEERSIKKYRKKFVPLIRGTVLDIAAGTGNNIEYYPENSEVTLLDSSSEMLKIAKKKAKDRKDLTLEYISQRIEDFELPDNYFDTILSIDVFCSVQDQDKAMQNIKRVLKNDGKIIFVEHMKTESVLKNIPLYFSNLFTYPTVGSSMVKETDKKIEKYFKILEKEKLNYSFRYYLVTK
ncbi:MAG: class I SAM-dependent methyltransferase [Thermotogota bacterium]